jgi:hypothetical protein
MSIFRYKKESAVTPFGADKDAQKKDVEELEKISINTQKGHQELYSQDAGKLTEQIKSNDKKIDEEYSELQMSEIQSGRKPLNIGEMVSDKDKTLEALETQNKILEELKKIQAESLALQKKDRQFSCCKFLTAQGFGVGAIVTLAMGFLLNAWQNGSFTKKDKKDDDSTTKLVVLKEINQIEEEKEPTMEGDKDQYDSKLIAQVFSYDDDAKYWNRLADFIDLDASTIADQLLYLTYTMMTSPITPFLWESTIDRITIIQDLVNAYVQNEKEQVTDFYRKAPSLQYQKQILPRIVAANLLMDTLTLIYLKEEIPIRRPITKNNQ